MFNRKTPAQAQLESVILARLTAMLEKPGTQEEFDAQLRQLTILEKLKDQNVRKPIVSEAALAVIGNLAGILLILHHEKAGVVTSKALSFVQKSR